MSSTHITTCLLCNPQKPTTIKANQMPAFRIGEAPPASVSRYLNALKEHIEKKHPEAYQYALAMGSTLSALVLFSHFTTTDPEMELSRDLTRAYVHKATRRNGLSEEDLNIRFEQLEYLIDREAGNDRAQAIQNFRDLCAYLLEEGEYASKAPEVSEVAR